MVTGPSSGKRDKPSSRLSAFVKSPVASGGDDSDVTDGFVMAETIGHYIDAEGNQIWICPTCSRKDDGSPMIGCDKCDDWYHWACVGITSEPAENTDWYCPRCVLKNQKKDKDRKTPASKRGRPSKR